MKKWLSENKKLLFKGAGTVVIAGLIKILIYYLPVIDDMFESIFLSFSETNKCKTLTSTISMPIEIEKGLCFKNESNTQKATIQLVTRNAFRFTNFNGTFSCDVGRTCSFGWPGAPKFNVISSANSENTVYIVGED